MLAECFAEQGGGRRNTVVFRGRQRSYAEYNATDVKGFYLKIVSIRHRRRSQRYIWVLISGQADGKYASKLCDLNYSVFT